MPATILLADDSPLARRMGTAYLTALGHDVREAASLEQAWGALEDIQPALVLAAAALPGGGGRALAQRLKAAPRWRTVPVILLLGALAPDLDYSPADGVIRKPLSPASLEALLAPWLARSPADLLVRAVREAAAAAGRGSHF